MSDNNVSVLTLSLLLLLLCLLLLLESVPVQGIFAVPSGPKMLEVAKHDMGRPAAGSIPRLVGRSYGQGVKPKQLM